MKLTENFNISGTQYNKWLKYYQKEISEINEAFELEEKKIYCINSYIYTIITCGKEGNWSDDESPDCPLLSSESLIICIHKILVQR